jgi:hypothetical protein
LFTREFDIEGENIIDVGMRPGLLNKSVDYEVSVHSSNFPDQTKLRVIVDGDYDTIKEFIDAITNEDIRIKQDTKKNYFLSTLREYDGPEIDWNRYEIRFMSKQMYRGFKEANQRLSRIERRQIGLTHKYLDVEY